MSSSIDYIRVCVNTILLHDYILKPCLKLIVVYNNYLSRACESVTAYMMMSNRELYL